MSTVSEPPTTFKSRSVDVVLLSKEQAEGMGATVRRSIGRPELRQLSPFLMLDEFNSGKPAGFPSHPHRGFETVTYMISGAFQHEDFCGHKGKIESGDLQWMTAGRGIVHAEMPYGEGKSHGLQLWVNLSAKDKMVQPAYQELKKEDVPVATTPDGGIKAVVIAGPALGITSPVVNRTPVHYCHYFLKPNQQLEHKIPEGFNSFLYTLNGKVAVGDSDKFIGPHNTITLTQGGDGVTVKTGAEEADFVLIAGQPINEPVAQMGPFVMNTQAELEQALRDYRSSSNGFEGASTFVASIDPERY